MSCRFAQKSPKALDTKEKPRVNNCGFFISGSQQMPHCIPVNRLMQQSCDKQPLKHISYHNQAKKQGLGTS